MKFLCDLFWRKQNLILSGDFMFDPRTEDAKFISGLPWRRWKNMARQRGTTSLVWCAATMTGCPRSNPPQTQTSAPVPRHSACPCLDPVCPKPPASPVCLDAATRNNSPIGKGVLEAGRVFESHVWDVFLSLWSTIPQIITTRLHYKLFNAV